MPEYQKAHKIWSHYCKTSSHALLGLYTCKGHHTGPGKQKGMAEERNAASNPPSEDGSVRGGHRPGAEERRAGELESGLGGRDGQETMMGLSLGPLSRVDSAAWEYPLGAL